MRITNLLAPIVIVVFITGCSSEDSETSTKPVAKGPTLELAKKVQSHIEQGWQANPELALGEIKKFILVHIDGKIYKGSLIVEQDGQAVEFAVDVTADNNSFEYEIAE